MEARSKRPTVDVVVPFVGSGEDLRAVAARMCRLEAGPGDTLTIVDNRPEPDPPAELASVRIVHAPERQSSYFARNRGASVGAAEWLVFMDADVEPPADLLDRYFADPVPDHVGVLAGAVVDEPLTPGAPQPAAARYAMLRAPMSQSVTMSGPWPYAQTANCAVRRTAFEEIGGFRDNVRSGGDADLCWRLQAAGWKLADRPAATATHRSRRTLGKLLRQRARHGAGAAWLRREHPGALPSAHWLGLVKWTFTSFAGALVAQVRGRHDDALVRAIDPLCGWAFELGRLFGNEVDAR
jgi:GT2 family glycosyltransferase